MVQTRRYKGRNPSNYWKLLEARTKKEALAFLWNKGANVIKSMSVARAKHLYLRAQRDLLVYDKCSTKELQKFCIARNIQSDVPKSKSWKANVDILVARLESADEIATFERFLDLPPELRLLVYGHYFADTCALLRSQTGGMLHNQYFDFVEPPITMSTSLLRRESLPEFYDHFQFLAAIYYVPFPELRRVVWDTLNFIPKAPQEVLNRLQHITFSGNLVIDPSEEGGHWEVAIKLKTGEVKVRETGQLKWNPRPGLPAGLQTLMERRAKKYVEDRQQNGGSTVTLRAKDTAGVEKLFEPLKGAWQAA